MPAEVRMLTVADAPAAWELGRLAFGGERTPPASWPDAPPGRQTWGVFDERGRLVAKAVDREQGHWFGGRLVPASGVAGVAVAPEVRGTGLARQVMTALLGAARDRGAVISTLFRTHPGLYRALGYEEVGALVWTTRPTSSFASVPAPADITLRQAELADIPAVLEVYGAIARAGTGLLERSGPLFDTSPEAVLRGHDGITLAENGDGQIEGYASWDRGPGYDASGRLSVPDLFGLTARATTALVAMLGSWGGVAPTLQMRLTEPDPVTVLAPDLWSRVESRDPWMLRVLDAAGAVAARGWPPDVTGSADLHLDDDLCPWNAGPYRLVIEAGCGRLEPGGRGDVRVSPRGLAMLYAGAADPALLRRVGLLAGSTASDGFLQVATAGPRPALLDYF